MPQLRSHKEQDTYVKMPGSDKDTHKKSPTAPPRSKKFSGESSSLEYHSPEVAKPDEVHALQAQITALKDDLTRYRQFTNNQLQVLVKEAHLKDVVKGIQDSIAVETGVFIRRIEDLENRVTAIESKFHFDPEVSIIAQGVPSQPTEDPVKVADDLIRQGLGVVNVPVVRAKRIPSRNPTKPGLLKIELKDLEQKKSLLKRKRSLKDTQTYKNVYIRGSKSHVERLIELNTYTLLQELPFGEHYRITGSGRLIRRDGFNQGRQQPAWGQGQPQGPPPPWGPGQQHGPRPTFNQPTRYPMPGPAHR